MAKGGRLKAALNVHKGVDPTLERQKQLQKQAAKRKAIQKTHREEQNLLSKDGLDEVEDIEAGGVSLALEDDGEEDGPVRIMATFMLWFFTNILEQLDIYRIDETSSSSEEENNNDEDQLDDRTNSEETSDIEGLNGVSLPPQIQGNGKIIEDDTEDIPFSDIASLDSEERGDIVPFQRLTINNHAALSASLSRVALPSSTLPFSTLQIITSSTPTLITDVNDDLNRELEFYAQSLAAVKEARKQLKAEGVPFSRPNDYFAEMVKSEEHMGRVRQRLVDDAAGKKAATEARRQRDLKKFGKAVQVAKQQERDKAKRETLDKINVLKRSKSTASLLPLI
jgi:rRNA-processing protein EBP2